MANLIGQELGGYQIVEEIGQGGMAAVYKAYESATDRYVAIKILPQLFTRDPRFVERFKREAQALAKLEHLHILPIHAYGEQDGITYLAMRYIPTGSLKDRIRRGPLPLQDVCGLLRQIAAALDYAHRHGIFHRDVKPANILLDGEGNAYLTDFGIARMVGATADLTGSGIIGTPAYMSPEQLEESALVVPASDQYALGIVLYEMVTGRTPYLADTPVAMITKKLTAPLPPPSEFNPNLPEAVEHVILRALARDPEARFDSCSELAEQFAAALGGMPVDVQPPAVSSNDLTYDYPAGTEAFTPTAPASPAPTAIPDGPTVTERRRMPAWLIGLIAVLGVVAVGAVIFFGRRGPGAATSDPAQPGEDTDASLPATQSALTAYDNFDNPEFDGSFNAAIWVQDDSLSAEALAAHQEDGRLVLDNVPLRKDTERVLRFPDTWTQENFDFIEGKLQIGDDATGDLSIVKIQLFSSDWEWWAEVRLTADPNAADPWFACDVNIDHTLEILKEIPIEYNTWYATRIEVDWDTESLNYYLDDQLKCIYPLPAGMLEDTHFAGLVGIWQPANASVTAYIDDVRVGYLADEAANQPTPTAYDDFNNPEYDGSFNTDLWVHDDDLSAEILAAHQQDGYLVFDNAPFSEETDRSIRIPAILTQEDFDFVEGKLRLDDDVTGGFSMVKLQLSGDTWEWWAQVYLSGVPDQVDPWFSCDISINNEPELLKEIPIEYNVWYTTRIEVDWDTESLNYYLDDQLKCTYPLPSGMLDDAAFRVEVGVWQETNASITAYIDDMSFGLLEP